MRERTVAEGPATTNKMSEAISRALPFLRRYPRAVTGSQNRADEWVRLCAELAMQQPQPVAAGRVGDIESEAVIGVAVADMVHIPRPQVGGLAPPDKRAVELAKQH